MGSENVTGWNEQVRQLADELPDSAETRFGFSCQCGCGTIVALTSRNFDANGAWADGHKPAISSDLTLHLPPLDPGQDEASNP